jgi:hypothetical protein
MESRELLLLDRYVWGTAPEAEACRAWGVPDQVGNADLR